MLDPRKHYVKTNGEVRVPLDSFEWLADGLRGFDADNRAQTVPTDNIYRIVVKGNWMVIYVAGEDHRVDRLGPLRFREPVGGAELARIQKPGEESKVVSLAGLEDLLLARCIRRR